MDQKTPFDLREMLIDAHAHFFFLQAKGPQRLRLWEIHEDSLVVDRPSAAAMHKTVVGLIPTLDGKGVYEIEGTVEPDALPDQTPETIRVHVSPSGVRKLDRRNYPRAHFAPPIVATIAFKGGTPPLAARVVNLSAGGLRIETDRELPADSAFRLSFEVECEDEIHEIVREAQILYTFPMEAGFSYGAKFVSRTTTMADGKREAPLEEIEKTVDLLDLVNRLLVWK